ncbi:DUF1266 domain-containing protein [Sinomonas mesophila]|uniref:DUF1266 domain-containing protein n=1 Tax=Sinomonas mesophila TaxID=1531955 RepID=UPI0009841F93|nr:DUF1266 domain-containing protein [Sinomonas mesophila]
MTLQNHPGDREFPVAWRWRFRKLRADAIQPREAKIWRGVKISAAAAAFVTVLVLKLLALPSSTFLVVIVAAMWAYWIVDLIEDATVAGQPLREQRRYIDITGHRALSGRQQQLLALSAQDDFARGLWNSSLEYRPAAVAVSGWKPGDEAPKGLTLLRPIEPEALRMGLLDHETGRLTAFDERLGSQLADESVSWQLLGTLEGPGRAEAAARLARILSTSPDHVVDVASSEPGRPPKLAWALDVQRAVDLARVYYMAGVLTEEEAWDRIEDVARIATGLFSSWDEYWDNLRIGVAFASNDLATVREFDALREKFKTSSWPAASVPFPQPTRAGLPPSVQAMRPPSPER